jgi:hypothetical protein
VPDPVPAPVTVREYVCATKVAVTLRAWLMVTLHAPVPLQAPLQPEKVEPAAGVAVKVTLVPDEKLALQVLPQVIPAGVLVTLPLPVPLLLAVRV